MDSKQLKEFIKELKHNHKINLYYGYTDTVNIDYVIEKLEKILEGGKNEK